MKIERVLEDEKELYVEYENGEIFQVDAGWWHGCYICDAYKDQIEDIFKDYGDKAACKYALEKLVSFDRRYLCEECYNHVVNQEMEKE